MPITVIIMVESSSSLVILKKMREREISSQEVQVNANKMSFHKHNLTTGDVRDGMLKTEKKKKLF